MKPVLALAVKDLRLLVRDRFALFWILAFPLMFALFFGAIFGDGGEGGGALSLAIVDEDASDGSRALVASLAVNDSVRLTRVGEGSDAPLETLALERARELVQKGQRLAYLRIPAGYGANPYAVFGAGGDAAATPQLEVGIDPGRRAEAGFLQGVLMEATFSALQQRLLDPELVSADLAAARADVSAASDLAVGQKLALQAFLGALEVFVERFDLGALQAQDGGQPSGFGQPLQVVDVSRDRSDQPRSTWDITFPQALVWGLMSVAMSFAITLVRERSSGTLLRLRMAPIGRAELLAGKALACFLASLATMGLLLAFGSLALGLRPDSPGLLLVAMLATAACFTGLMMVSSVLGKTEAAVAGASWGLMMPFAMVGGGMIPLIAMPGWLVTASAVSPFKWAILAVEGAIWRGFGPADMVLPCTVLLAMGAGFFGLGLVVFRKLGD